MSSSTAQARAPAAGGDQQIVTLNPNDVIFGRGLGYSQFSGNQKFLQLVSKMKDTYKQTDRKGKDKIARYVIEYIHKKLNGRFLKATEEQTRKDRVRVWQEVPDKVALQKVKQALREPKNEDQEKRVAALGDSRKNHIAPSSVASAQAPCLAAVANSAASSNPYQAWPAPATVPVDATQPILGPTSFFGASAQGFSPQHYFQPTQPLSNARHDPNCLHGQVVPDARQAVAAANLSTHQSLGMNDLLQQEFNIFTDSLIRCASDLFTSSIVRNSLQNTTPLQNTAQLSSHPKRPLDKDTNNMIQLPPSSTARGHFVSQSSALNEAKSKQVKAGAIAESAQQSLTTTSQFDNEINSDEVSESDAIDSAASALVNILDTTTEKDVNDFLMSALQEDDPDTPRITPEQEAEERAHLSVEEEEAMLADVFGNLCQINPSTKRLKRDVDDAACVQSLLKEMESEIENMPASAKMALLEACQKAAAKEFSDERLKLFLHCEGMCPRMAARRFVLYWQRRREWFGADKFFLPMTQSAALRDDMVALRCGYLGILDDLDASGRQILVLLPRLNTFEGYSPESSVRSWWYMIEVVSEHVNAHKGLVLVNWAKDSLIWNFHRKAKGFRAIIELEREAWPIKFRAIHMWHQNTFVRDILRPVVFGSMDKRFRCRVVDHENDENVVHSMENYGISQDILPIEMGGKSEYDQSEWLVRRQRFEEQRDTGG